jgi:hypothetical protein
MNNINNINNMNNITNIDNIKNDNNYNCTLCNYNTYDRSNFLRHIASFTHINNAEIRKTCVLCNKKYETIQKYKTHINNVHNKKIKKYAKCNTKKNNDNNDNTDIVINKVINIKNDIKNDIKIVNDKVLDVKNNVLHVNEKVSEVNEKVSEVKDEIIEVKQVVNKAITKASTLIKYLMEHHSSTPPLKRINKDSINILRLDYNCPLKPNTEYDYSLEDKLVRQYKNNIFIQNIAKSILNLVHYKDHHNQSIYNTDCARNNYVVKTTTKWNEDKAGIKFCDYVIKPFLSYIKNIITDYRIHIEQIDILDYDFNQIEMHNINYLATLKFEAELSRETLIKSILKELSPYLRYLEKEIEELETYTKIDKLQNELQEIIKSTKSDNSDNSDNSDSDD